MATRRLLKHSSNAVSTGALVTFDIPSFDTICQMGLTFTNSGAPATLANIKSSVSKITVLINGEQVLNASASDLANVWDSLGTQVAGSLVNSIPLMLGHLLYKLPEAEDTIGDIGCERYAQGQKVSNIQIQVQFGTVTSIDLVQAYTERVNKGTGRNVTNAILKLLTYAETGSVGPNEVPNLPKDADMGRLFTLCEPVGSTVISKGEALLNNDPVIQDADLATNAMLVQQRGFAQPTGCFLYSFTDGGMQDLLSMKDATDFRLRTTLTTAGSYTLVDATVRVVN